MKTAENIVDQNFRSDYWLDRMMIINSAAKNIVIEAMEEYADQYKSKWISVTERLPETDKHNESEEVLCYSELTRQFVGWYNSEKKEWCASVFTASNDEICSVTHWKHLDENPE